MQASAEMRAHYLRAFDRASRVIRPGDKVKVLVCGGGHAHYLFGHWDLDHPGFFVSKGGVEDLHAYNITQVNGVEMTFRDPAMEPA